MDRRRPDHPLRHAVAKAAVSHTHDRDPLPWGRLFIHSPTPLVPELKAEIERAGNPRWIIGPNRIHYWWIPEWRDAFRDADIYLAPRVREQAGSRIDFDFFTLDRDSGYPWDAEIATLAVAGRFMTEVELFHRASRTLILTDLIENFEPRKLDSVLMRWLTWIAGVSDPMGRCHATCGSAFRRWN